jgi:hypothetical protein
MNCVDGAYKREIRRGEYDFAKWRLSKRKDDIRLP